MPRSLQPTPDGGLHERRLRSGERGCERPTVRDAGGVARRVAGVTALISRPCCTVRQNKETRLVCGVDLELRHRQEQYLW